MKIENNERALHTLEIVAEAGEPVGSWHIVNELEQRGIEVSSATVGRLLNQLEQRGYLTKHNIRGRTITTAGREAINAAYTAQKMEKHKKDLDDLINSNVLNKFLMVLEARQAIEKTTAKLAAQRITSEQLARLRDLVDKQEQDYQQQRSIAEDDIDFHRTIAEASGNKALASLYMILSMMGQQSELFEHLRTKVHSTYVSAHTAIYQALEARSPDDAERAMELHLEQLRQDVRSYWDTFYHREAPTDSAPQQDPE